MHRHGEGEWGVINLNGYDSMMADHFQCCFFYPEHLYVEKTAAQEISLNK